MEQTKRFILFIFCTIFVIWFAESNLKYLVMTTPIKYNDFATFHRLLRQKDTTYKSVQYAHIQIHKVDGNTVKATYGEISDMVNLNTPLMTLLLKGLMNTSDHLTSILWVWIGLSLLGAGLGLWIVLPYFGEASRPWFYFFLLFPIFLLSYPAIFNAYGGQISFFIFPFFCLAFILCYSPYQKSAAVLLGLLAAAKLFFALFLLFYGVQRAWKLSAYFLLSFFIFFFAPLFFFSLHDYAAFYKLTHEFFIFIGRSASARNGSLLGFVANIFYFLFPTATLLQLRIAAYLLVGYVVIRAVIFDYRKLCTLPEYRDELRFSFYIIIALLCSPLAWIYYFVFLCAPLAMIFKVSRRYTIPALFYLLFFIAMTLPLFGIVVFPKYDLPLLVLRQFALSVDLVCWLFCIVWLSHIVRQKYFLMVPEYAASQRKILSMICILLIIVPALSEFALWGNYFFLISYKPITVTDQPVVYFN